MTPTDSLSGDTRPGGSQGFPGYSKANEVQRDRSNASFYVDTEFNITEEFLLSGAVRYEDYSDFGNSFNYKLASRYKITDGLSFRASLSSGFRAPSLAQIYYNLRFTNFVGGDAQEVLLASNNSPVARGFGIETLKEEKAQNTSLGLTFKKSGFTATFDVYNINIKDRIVLTDQFDASHLGINVVAAQFFVNGIDTKTQGIDIVLGYKKDIGANSLNVGLTGNINKLEIEKINNRNLDVNTFFGPREQYFLKAAAPNNKFGLNIGFDMAKFNLGLAVTRFSEVIILDWQAYESDDDYDSPEAKIKAAEDVYEAGFVVDLVANYKFSKQLNFTIGANNLLNVYPTIQDDWTDSGGYWDSVQMGTNGRYLFARLGFDF